MRGKMRRKPQKKNRKFWDKEYKDSSHLALSQNPSEDLEKFTRWLLREYPGEVLNKSGFVLDIGSGNGRNLIFLANEFGISGLGYDISQEAVEQAKTKSEGLNLSYEARSIAGIFSKEEESCDLVLDMMTSHFLRQKERENLQKEIYRILKPGGWLFMKTFLLDDDQNAKRMIKDYPADEPNSYIHPELGAFEHVYSEKELIEDLSKMFEVKKVLRSHGHLRKGKPKRRSVCVYAQKAY